MKNYPISYLIAKNTISYIEKNYWKRREKRWKKPSLETSQLDLSKDLKRTSFGAMALKSWMKIETASLIRGSYRLLSNS
jgi:hypothetical protein